MLLIKKKILYKSIKLLDDVEYKKFKVEIKSNTKKNVLFSFIQDWIRRKSSEMELQLIGLRIYRYEKDVQNFKFNNLKCLSFLFF